MRSFGQTMARRERSGEARALVARQLASKSSRSAYQGRVVWYAGMTLLQRFGE